jgi:signal transduction histidine kinase
MTVRLVALMSIVLLLSLGAFGLLIDHYQSQVISEVGRTASDVGRAMLLRLESPLHDGLHEAQLPPAEVHWTAAGPAGEAGDPTAAERRVVVATVTRLNGGGESFEEVAQHLRLVGAACNEPGADSRAAPVVDVEREFLVDVAEIRTEPDVAGGLVLKIPGFTPDASAGDTRGTPSSAEPPFERDEIRLPIEVGPFETLFNRVRGRSLALFCGVFAVGTVLSAGLASRFTRPIRRLDAGIRRLAAGDLDVRVPAEGRDEIARLGRAFNEMAGLLRANRERETEIARREKLSALGRLAAGVAHDVRNPLHSIGLTLQHLSETARPEAADRASEFDRSLEVIRDEIRRLDRLVANFLGFARSERRERAKVDLAGLMRETASLVGKEAEWRGVSIEVAVGPDVPAVVGDAETLRAALLNLVLNSLESMPGGGRLTLRLLGEPGKAVLEVVDTGEGIAPEHRERVFEFAYTTRAGGHGLGLAMVHHCVVEEHGGRIWLDSTPGEGTSVRIALPAPAGVPA